MALNTIKKLYGIYSLSRIVKRASFALITSIMVCGCLIPPDSLPVYTQQTTAPKETWEIIDFENRENNGTIPDWVFFYLDEKQSLIENMIEYSNYYVFISMNAGTNFNALRQWRTAFSPDLDFARLIAGRIEKRFLDAAAIYPDDEYGVYFEAIIRAASDAQWEDAVRAESFWVQRRFTFNEETPGTELYNFLIMVIIEKDSLIPQVEFLLRDVQSRTQLTRYQRNAVSKVLERFFDGF